VRIDAGEPQAHIYGFGNFCVNAAKRLLLKGEGETIPLMPKAFDTLLYLVEHHGKLIEKDELMAAIWADTIVEENNLTQNISILRRVLGEKHGENRFIATVPGHGYKFVAEVRKIDAAERPEPLVGADGSNPVLTESETLKIKDRTTNRFWFAALAAFSVFALGSFGFYQWRANATFADLPIKTIAVLPFKPLVAESGNEALGMGMADTLINKISTSGEIIVRPLGSVSRYNALEQDSLLAGRQLAVDSVLEGNIQTSGERIRISARLIRTGDGKQLWTGQFDEKFTDIFAVQDSISERVLAALALNLSGDEKKRLTKRYTEDVEAYQLYMRGSFHASKLILPEAQKGVEYYQQAIAIDPNYALPYVGLAQAYVGFSLSGDIPANETMLKAKAAALRAVELDQTTAESQVAAGMIAYWYDWNWSEAEKRFRRALELDANNARAYFFYAHLNSTLGRHEEAITMGKRARELDPLSLITNSAEGQFLFYAGRSDEALSRLHKTLELYSDFWHTHLILSNVYTEKGMFAEAVAEADTAANLSGGNFQAVATRGYALAKSGKLAEAQAVLAELQKSSATRYVAPYNFAIIYNALGETHTALDYLEKAFAEKNVLMVFLKIDPKWNNLRNDPRYNALLRRISLQPLGTPLQ
jgi:DNA-binding winged helix-turn-helix (wHTH) protein/TolB-like protein/Flp pilus assembly protein TadD